jgi:hypothetical protein
VTARAGALTQVRLVQSGTSYISQDDMRSPSGWASWRTSTPSTFGRTAPPRRENVKAGQILVIMQAASSR